MELPDFSVESRKIVKSASDTCCYCYCYVLLLFSVVTVVVVLLPQTNSASTRIGTSRSLTRWTPHSPSWPDTKPPSSTPLHLYLYITLHKAPSATNLDSFVSCCSQYLTNERILFRSFESASIYFLVCQKYKSVLYRVVEFRTLRVG